jgi:phage baseplate assembly protein W
MDWSSIMKTAISFPFTMSVNGVIESTSDTSKIFLDRVVTLLSTQVGQRPFYPEYGVDWSTALFENENNATVAIPSAINLAVARWIPEVSVEEVILPAASLGLQEVSVHVRLPSGDMASIQVSTGTINYDGTME